jgi:predicted ATPase
MLKRIGIENFKSFKELTFFEFERLNLVAGLNSSGKSSIYQALFLLIQSFGNTFKDQYGNALPQLNLNYLLARLGKNTEVLHDKDKLFLRFILTWDDGAEIKYTYTLTSTDTSTDENPGTTVFYLTNIDFKSSDDSGYKVDKYNDKWTVEATSTLTFSEYQLMGIIDEYVKTKIKDSNNKTKVTDEVFLSTVKFKKVNKVNLRYNALESFEVDFKEIINTIQPKLRKFIDFDELNELLEAKGFDNNNLILVNSNQESKRKYQLLDEDIVYLPPFRGYPQRIYTDTINPNPLGLYINNKRSQVLYNYDFVKEKPIKGSLEKAFNYWIVEHFQLGEKVCVEEPLKGLATEIYISQGGQKIPIINVGFGASQILPVIFRVLSNDGKELYVIDEPEIHLHPSLQSKLADFFFIMSLTGRNIFIETHSEYLIDKLNFLSIKYSLHALSINLCWVYLIKGMSRIEKIKFDKLGYVINAPDGFLNEKSLLVEQINKLRLSIL